MNVDWTTIRPGSGAALRRAVRMPGLGSDGVGMVALGLLGAITAVAIGWAASGGRTVVAAPFVAGALVVLFVRAPEAPFLGVLAFASTFAVAYTLPKAGPLYPAEAVLLVGLVALPFVGSAALGGLIGVFLLIFLFAVFLGIVVAGGHGVTVHNALLEARTPVLYGSFWLALSAARANRRRALSLVTAIAVVISLLSIAQFLLPGVHLFRSGESSVVTPDNGFLRVRPPGLILVYFGAIFSISYLFWGPRRRRAPVLALLGLFGATILISLNRNMIVGLGAGLLVALVVIPRRSQAALRIAVAGLAAIILLTFVGSGTVGQRILSLGNAGYLQRTTLADRQYEDRFARATIARHPVSGIGWGVAYGANVRTTSGVIQNRGFVHNQYYALLLRVGALGLLSYLGMLGATVLVGMRLARRRPWNEESWLGAAIVAAVVGFAASSVVGIYVLDAGSTPAVAALLALAAFLGDAQRREGMQRPVEAAV
jgi:O-antigen ligase